MNRAPTIAHQGPDQLCHSSLRSITKEAPQIGRSGRTVATPLDSPLCRPYCTALIMSKIGRYMATTMPPTTTPRNTIITGSSIESRFDTAASTSSS